MTISNWIGIIVNILLTLCLGGTLFFLTRKVKDLDNFFVSKPPEDSKPDDIYIPLN